MKKQTLLILTALSLGIVIANFADAADRERPFKRGRGGFRGNERSERVNQFSVGEANYAGPGCPSGTMSLAMAPDNLSFSILFDQFVAESGSGTDSKKRDMMACTAVIPFEIPEGMQMEITRVDFRGFVAIPQGGKAVLHSIFNFTEKGDRRDGRGRDRDRINIRYGFEGPLAENYEISTGSMGENGITQTEVSPCGGKTRLRIANQILVKSGRSGETATATIDSIDGSSNAVYFVNWKKCEMDNSRGDREFRDRRPGNGNHPNWIPSGLRKNGGFL